MEKPSKIHRKIADWRDYLREIELISLTRWMAEWSKAPPQSPREKVAAEEVWVRISAEYIRFFDHFWRCVHAYSVIKL